MNLQMERIQQACDSLKLCTLATEWSAIADNAAGKESSLAVSTSPKLRQT